MPAARRRGMRLTGGAPSVMIRFEMSATRCRPNARLSAASRALPGRGDGEVDDAYFMEKALEEAEQALAAGEFPVGCILATADRVVASGARTGTRGQRPNEVDHAEILALRRLVALDEAIDPSHVTAYTTMEPCLMCYGALILSRIGRVVWAYEDVMGGGTGCDLSALPALYRNSAIVVVPGFLRDRSRALFRRFFSQPQNDYWRGSLLAAHALGTSGDEPGSEWV